MLYTEYSVCVYLDMCDAFAKYIVGNTHAQNKAIGDFRRLWRECLDQFKCTQVFHKCLELVFKTYEVKVSTQEKFKKDFERGYIR